MAMFPGEEDKTLLQVYKENDLIARTLIELAAKKSNSGLQDSIWADRPDTPFRGSNTPRVTSSGTRGHGLEDSIWAPKKGELNNSNRWLQLRGSSPDFKPKQLRANSPEFKPKVNFKSPPVEAIRILTPSSQCIQSPFSVSSWGPSSTSTETFAVNQAVTSQSWESQRPTSTHATSIPSKSAISKASTHVKEPQATEGGPVQVPSTIPPHLQKPDTPTAKNQQPIRSVEKIVRHHLGLPQPKQPEPVKLPEEPKPVSIMQNTTLPLFAQRQDTKIDSGVSSTGSTSAQQHKGKFTYRNSMGVPMVGASRAAGSIERWTPPPGYVPPHLRPPMQAPTQYPKVVAEPAAVESPVPKEVAVSRPESANMVIGRVVPTVASQIPPVTTMAPTLQPNIPTTGWTQHPLHKEKMEFFKHEINVYEADRLKNEQIRTAAKQPIPPAAIRTQQSLDNEDLGAPKLYAEPVRNSDQGDKQQDQKVVESSRVTEAVAAGINHPACKPSPHERPVETSNVAEAAITGVQVIGRELFPHEKPPKISSHVAAKLVGPTYHHEATREVKQNVKQPHFNMNSKPKKYTSEELLQHHKEMMEGIANMVVNPYIQSKAKTTSGPQIKQNTQSLALKKDQGNLGQNSISQNSGVDTQSGWQYTNSTNQVELDHKAEPLTKEALQQAYGAAPAESGERSVVSDSGVEEIREHDPRGRLYDVPEQFEIHWDGTWGPEYRDWHDRPEFEDAHVNEYIKQWAHSLRDMPPVHLETTNPAFSAGIYGWYNQFLEVEHPPCTPNPASENAIRQFSDCTTSRVAEHISRRAKRSHIIRQSSIFARHNEAQLTAPQANPTQDGTTSFESVGVHLKLPLYIRPAAKKDLIQVAQIYNHYVLNSDIPEDQAEVKPSDFEQVFADCQSSYLPFIVAINSYPPTKKDQKNSEKVIGFAWAEEWSVGIMGANHGRSRHTGKVNLYVDPTHTKKGVGYNLLDRLLEVMTRGYTSQARCPFVAPKQAPYVPGGGGKKVYHQVMMEMPYRESNMADQERLENWLRNHFRFMRVANLEGVARTKARGMEEAQFLNVALLQRYMDHYSIFSTIP